MKLCVILGTRPEIIKMSCLLSELDRFFDVDIIHTGQNYSNELNEVFFENLGLRKPDFLINSAGSTTIETLSNMLVNVDKILSENEYDAFFVFGDTNSGICSYCAKRRRIPVIHLEAGNRSFDDRIPEEVNRRIIDNISDANLCLSEHARQYLLKENHRPDLTINVGSPIGEIFEKHKDKILTNDILSKLKLKKNSFIVLSSHREENVDFNFNKLFNSIEKLAKKENIKVVVTTHPRIKHKVEKLNLDNIIFIKALGIFDYWTLQLNAKCVISDSGTITEESSIFEFPAINLRESHERPEGDSVGAVPLATLEFEKIYVSYKMAIDHSKNRIKNFTKIADYSDTNFSKKICRLIPGLINKINRIKYYE